jgi:site-specific DNA-adenine methylase
MALVPYVGGKSDLWLEVYSAIQTVMIEDAETDKWDGTGYEYREPFLGGGAVFLHHMVGKVKRVWLNDKDSGMACLATAALRCPDKLLARLRPYHEKPPSKKEFDGWQGVLKSVVVDPEKASEEEIVNHGFIAMATPYLSYKSVQENPSYQPSKWSISAMTRNVNESHKTLKSVKFLRITCRDYNDLLTAKGKALIYCDPPYVTKGNYRTGNWTKKCHERLAKALKTCKKKWVLSYDDAPLVRSLYGEWCNWLMVKVKYDSNKPRRPMEELILWHARGKTPGTVGRVDPGEKKIPGVKYGYSN